MAGLHNVFSRKRMITIVTHFRAQVVKFIFRGRNSGQGRNERDMLPYTMPIRCQ